MTDLTDQCKAKGGKVVDGKCVVPKSRKTYKPTNKFVIIGVLVLLVIGVGIYSWASNFSPVGMGIEPMTGYNYAGDPGIVQTGDGCVFTLGYK